MSNGMGLNGIIAPLDVATRRTLQALTAPKEEAEVVDAEARALVNSPLADSLQGAYAKILTAMREYHELRDRVGGVDDSAHIQGLMTTFPELDVVFSNLAPAHSKVDPACAGSPVCGLTAEAIENAGPTAGTRIGRSKDRFDDMLDQMSRQILGSGAMKFEPINLYDTAPRFNRDYSISFNSVQAAVGAMRDDPMAKAEGQFKAGASPERVVADLVLDLAKKAGLPLHWLTLTDHQAEQLLFNPSKAIGTWWSDMAPGVEVANKLDSTQRRVGADLLRSAAKFVNDLRCP